MGKIYVIGIGPGGAQETTPRAQGGEGVAEGDDGKVVDQGCPQQGGPGGGGSDPGDDLDLQLRGILADLVDQSRHAVDPGVPGADHGHRPAL